MAQDPIYIKPSHRGLFTEQALKHHEGVQAFAHHIIADPGDYSTKERERAEFAANAAKWHHG